MGLVAAVSAFVIAGLWTLDHVELVPFARWRTWIARLAVVPLVGSIYFVPSAFNAGVEWFVERETNEMLERIQPILDEFTPTSNPESSADG